jgi:hypothetical protein
VENFKTRLFYRLGKSWLLGWVFLEKVWNLWRSSACDASAGIRTRIPRVFLSIFNEIHKVVGS